MKTKFALVGLLTFMKIFTNVFAASDFDKLSFSGCAVKQIVTKTNSEFVTVVLGSFNSADRKSELRCEITTKGKAFDLNFDKQLFLHYGYARAHSVENVDLSLNINNSLHSHVLSELKRAQINNLPVKLALLTQQDSDENNSALESMVKIIIYPKEQTDIVEKRLEYNDAEVSVETK
jgi:hypothetical protein